MGISPISRHSSVVTWQRLLIGTTAGCVFGAFRLSQMSEDELSEISATRLVSACLTAVGVVGFTFYMLRKENAQAKKEKRINLTLSRNPLEIVVQ